MTAERIAQLKEITRSSSLRNKVILLLGSCLNCSKLNNLLREKKKKNNDSMLVSEEPAVT